MFNWFKKKDSKSVQSVLSASVMGELVRSIKSLPEIPTRHFDIVYQAAERTIAAGRTLSELSREFTKIDGMTPGRAGAIALLLSNRAGVIGANERQLSLGIERAVWRHAGAPCLVADKSHQALDGRSYSLKAGLLLNGKQSWPGYEEGSKCFSRPVIAGFED